MFIKSLEALVAIIGDSVVVFYNSKNLNCIGVLRPFFQFFQLETMKSPLRFVIRAIHIF